jgi:hypothetical protein
VIERHIEKPRGLGQVKRGIRMKKAIRRGVGSGRGRERRSAADWVHEVLAGAESVPGGARRDTTYDVEST